MNAELTKYWKTKSWHSSIKRLIARLVKRESSPRFKRQVASVLESQAKSLREFADTQPQTVKEVTPLPKRIVEYLKGHPDGTIAELVIAMNISKATASRWRRQYNQKHSIPGRPRGRPKKGTLHV
jgi:Helix-turn-helix domain